MHRGRESPRLPSPSPAPLVLDRPAALFAVEPPVDVREGSLRLGLLQAARHSTASAGQDAARRQ